MIARRLGYALALAALFLAVAAGLRAAEANGLVGADLARRAVQVIIGLGLAAWANFMPKQVGRAKTSLRAESWSQKTLRVGGWSMTLAGLAYAALWAFAPLSFANVASIAVVAGAMVVLLGFAIWSFLSCRRAGDLPARR